MFEIACQYLKAPAVRQAVCKKSDKCSAEDREQAQSRPGKNQKPEPRPVDGFDISLRRREHIDDAAKKHRLRKQCQGHCYVGEGQNPAQTAVSAELCEDASVELQKAHGRILDASRAICFPRVVRGEAQLLTTAAGPLEGRSRICSQLQKLLAIVLERPPSTKSRHPSLRPRRSWACRSY